MTQKIKDFFQISPYKITFFVILLALLLFLFDFGFLRLVELKTLDLRIASRGVLQPGGETVIAVIDEKSLSELGRWPWPRTTLSQLVDTLKASGAKAIGFDIVFSEPDENSSLKTIDELSAEMRKGNAPNSSALSILAKKRAAADTDATLARSISRAQNVTLGYFFHFQGRQKELDLSHIKEGEIIASAAGIANSRYPMINSSGITPDDSQLPNAFAPEANIKSLMDAAQNSGYFNAIPDSDGSNRWSPLVIKFRDNYYFPLSIAMVQQYLDGPQLALNLEKYGAQSVKDWRHRHSDGRSRPLTDQLSGAGKDFYPLLDCRYYQGPHPGGKFPQQDCARRRNGHRHLRFARHAIRRHLSRSGNSCHCN